MEQTRGPITPDSVISEVVAGFPETGLVLLQHGRMFRSAKGNLYADFSRLTVREFATLNGLEVERLLRSLNAAVEGAEMARQYSRGSRPPSDPMRRGAAIGHTSAYREPADIDVQDVVTEQTSRGPD